MVYPETFEETYQRYLAYFRKVSADEYKGEQPRVVIMVSHGQSIQSFMEVYDKQAREKDVIGVGYCCLSIITRSSTIDPWELVCLGDASHVGCGTSELIPVESD